MISLDVSYLSDFEIAKEADAFLKDRGLNSIPIDIERLIESYYRMDIIPVPGLQDFIDTEGFSTPDFTAIYVDDFVCRKRYYRYRYTLAHEIGHKVLHEAYLRKLHYSSISGWAKIVKELDPSDHDKMEYQAYVFAGMVLVPKSILEVEFKKALSLFQPQIQKAKSNGIDRDHYIGTVLDAIAYKLTSRFEVSTSVLCRRIKFNSLEQLI